MKQIMVFVAILLLVLIVVGYIKKMFERKNAIKYHGDIPLLGDPKREIVDCRP